MKQAAASIRAFHEPQRRSSWFDTGPGGIRGQLVRPLDRAGIYVPGGTASYPSTVLMTAIPAAVAGVPEIVMCTPARESGCIPPIVLFAARLAGVHRVVAAGGAQAIAAMAYGTRTVPAVDKIVGPGNAFVNAAKRLVWGVVDVDMLAGPSEVCIVADELADASLIAHDMLTQAEHDAESPAYLITPSEIVANAALKELDRLAAAMPRAAILQTALANHGAVVVTRSMEEAVELANACAPEHLALMVQEPFALLGSIRNAGAILMGNYTPQTLGDYMAGPSHTLPTSGTARFASPLHVDTFLKKSSFLYCTQQGLQAVSPHLEAFARAEGFEAHARAVGARRPDAG